jgi:Flp pilus assembly protein TadD
MKPTLEAAFNEIQQLIDQGRIDAAIQRLELISRELPDEARVHNDLAALLTRQEKYDKALDHYEKALALDPRNITTQKNLADLHAVVFGRFDRAIRLYTEVLKVEPQDEESLVALVKIAEAMGDHDNANRFMEQLKQAYPHRYDLSSTAGRDGVGEASFPAEAHTFDQPSNFDITAIVSTYNSERFMHGCLQNLLSQGLGERLEIIVIDAASEQDEKAIVEAFQKHHSNIVYHRTAQKETIYASWNRAARMARGRFLINSNTDDRHLPGALLVKMQALDRTPDAGLVYADLWITDVENDVFDPAHVNRYQRQSYPAFTPLTGLTGSNFSPHPMWRKSAHDTLGYFDDTYTVAGDYDFFFKIATDLGAVHVPEPLGLYYRNPEGIEFSNRETAVAEFRRMRQENYARLPLETFFPNIKTMAHDEMAKYAAYWELGNNCLMATLAREFELAIGYYTWAQEGYGDQKELINNLAIAHFFSGDRQTALALLAPASKKSLKSRLLYQQIQNDDIPLDKMSFQLESPAHKVVEKSRQGRRIPLDALAASSKPSAPEISDRPLSALTGQGSQRKVSTQRATPAVAGFACLAATGQTADQLIDTYAIIANHLPHDMRLRCVGHLYCDEDQARFEKETGLRIEGRSIVACINDMAKETTNADAVMWVLDGSAWTGADAVMGMRDCLQNMAETGVVAGLMSDFTHFGMAQTEKAMQRPHFEGMANSFYHRFKHRRHVSQRVESRCWLFILQPEQLHSVVI